MAISDSYQFIKDTLLRGGWESAQVTVTFYTYSGSRITSKTVTSGTTISSAASGVSQGSGPSGYVFKGWAYSKNATSALSSSTKITSNVSLYAAWAQYTDTLTSGYLSVGEIAMKLGITNPSSMTFLAYDTSTTMNYVGAPDSNWRLSLSYFKNGSYMRCPVFQVNGTASYRITQINNGSSNVSVAKSANGCAYPTKAKATAYSTY